MADKCWCERELVQRIDVSGASWHVCPLHGRNWRWPRCEHRVDYWANGTVARCKALKFLFSEDSKGVPQVTPNTCVVCPLLTQEKKAAEMAWAAEEMAQDLLELSQLHDQVSCDMVGEAMSNDALRLRLAVLEIFNPTPVQINALPEGVRRYIHDLETRCDPAGEVAELTLTRDQNAQLVAVAAAKDALMVVLKEALEASMGSCRHREDASWCEECSLHASCTTLAALREYEKAKT